MLPIASLMDAWAGDASLEAISIQEGCVPKTISKVLKNSLASVWKIDCAGDERDELYIECQGKDCRVKENDERSTD
jgi:hypothetical protein